MEEFINNNEQLLKGWSVIKLNDVAGENGIFCDGDWVESKDQDKDGEIRLIQLADVGDGEFKDKSDRHLTQAKATELNCTFLEGGDILIARMPEPLGRACIFPLKQRNKYVTVVDVCILRVDERITSGKYISYIINSPDSRASIAGLESGSTRKRISRINLGTIDFPLPPLPEQHRIIAKIEELFSELDKGVEALKTAQRQLKVYRQAVLQWAFEGKLTEEWRRLPKSVNLGPAINKIFQDRKEAFEIKLAQAKKNKAPKPKTPKNLDNKFKVTQDNLRFIGNKPNEWVVVHLAAISNDMPDSIVDGPFGSSINVENDYIESGVPVIRINNILPFIFEKNKLKYLREEKFKELRRHNVVPGDVLFGKVGTIGNSCIYPVSEPEAMLSTTGSCRIRVDEKIITNKFLCYYLNSQKRNFNVIASAAVQAFLNMETISNFPIPLCSLEEQHAIVAEIESRLSVADKIEETIVQSLKQAEALRQSILKKAFEGKLVPQDPNDEPAEKLLARIKAEKATRAPLKGPVKRRGAGRKAASSPNVAAGKS